MCIVHFAATTNTREYRKNAGAEQTLLKHMLSTTSTYFPPMALSPNLDGHNSFREWSRQKEERCVATFYQGGEGVVAPPF